MKLPNKLTILRLILSVIIIIILIFPFDTMGLSLPKIFINEALVVDTKYIITGFLFAIASLITLFDRIIARKYNLITDFSKMFASLTDKILVNSVLIILCAYGFIHPIIPVIIIIRDIVVNSIKMLASSKGSVMTNISSGKFKTVLLMIGVMLTLFYNLPFELWNLRISDFILIIACVLSIISGIQYYNLNKKIIVLEKN
ncbi:MAG: CDP-diacylglycerol--glycerol-3-phosphate 3-phosphatidyltransferase [Bacilli bacterium]